jgi:myo-inositol 2-dehydrogenase/D-chiro-inositol 1-dehydrogenase
MIKGETPTVFQDEEQLLLHVDDIDLLVIASPNHMHTPQLIRWGRYDIAILVEKPVAINEEQIASLKAANLRARIWVAMEYRFIPAINKLLQHLPDVGPIKKVTIRENRYPFLSKIEEWNKDVNKSGDTLVEKCCHFFDLFRLITGQEMDSCVSKIHRGLLWDHYGYQDHEDKEVIPIIDSAYVLLDFVGVKGVPTTANSIDSEASPKQRAVQHNTIGCLELCMFAEGSRHQEEIIVTGMKGRVEAYLPENKVFLYQRPTPNGLWKDKSKPPPSESFSEEIFDCSDLRQVYDFADSIPKMHSGYHYCSTAIEWKFLIDVIKDSKEGRPFIPRVTLDDGIKAVEMGIASMVNISNGIKVAPATAGDGAMSEIVVNRVPATSKAHDVTTVFINEVDSCAGSCEENMIEENMI